LCLAIRCRRISFQTSLVRCISDGKVYNISNQKLAALETNSGDTVEVTGTMKGDIIAVSKIAKK